MEVSWLQLSVSVLVLACAVLVLLVCVDCRTRGPQVSIAQAEASEEYIPSTEFRVIYPSLRTTDQNTVHSHPGLLSPFFNSLDPGSQRRQPSYTATETESNPSYENPGPESLESDVEDPGYIIVLPEGKEATPTSSRASTPSSDVQNDYVNIANPDYLNVEPSIILKTTPEVSTQADNDDDDDDEEDDSDSDDEGNYVNQPPSTRCMMGNTAGF